MSVDPRKQLEEALLDRLCESKTIDDSAEFLRALNNPTELFDAVTLESVITSLRGFEFIHSTETVHTILTLTSEAIGYAESGSPEGRVFSAIGESGISAVDLQSRLGKEVSSVGSGQLMKSKRIQFDKATQLYRRVDGNEFSDEIQSQLKLIQSGNGNSLDKSAVANLKTRKLLTVGTSKTYSIRCGPKFAKRRIELATDLTAEMLKSGEWSTAEFKEYDLNALGTNPASGCLHPLMKVRSQFRSILMEMGFSEMPTNNFVESSFWNFDSLFQPQQHPARDSHDTFFLSAPEKTIDIPADYCEKVKEMHEKGGAGSIGYRYNWKLDEAQKNILRTHTTAVSARMLYKIAHEPVFKPARLFSIDRVFRNETLDATHLAEFHQVEGLIADRNLTLGDLIGTIKIFFERIGISDVKFKPAYNPYTEPSMEIFGFSKQLNKWIEIGNSGVFRPEMLSPMGLPADVKVIAWGLSLERPTMIKYGIRNIRDLFGPKVKLNIIQNNPIARFDD